jgi:hypothetical protein
MQPIISSVSFPTTTANHVEDQSQISASASTKKAKFSNSLLGRRVFPIFSSFPVVLETAYPRIKKIEEHLGNVFTPKYENIH